MDAVTGVLVAAWGVFQASALYMLFGFFVAGLLVAFVNADKIARHLGKGRVRPVFLSALIGIPLPLCSCGVVPAAAGLKRQGANNGATLSFLVSTPETGVDSIPVTYALMDPVIAVIRPVAAFITAVTAGIVENITGSAAGRGQALQPAPLAGASTGCGCNSGGCTINSRPGPPLADRTMQGLRYAFVELLGDIGVWFLVGVLLAGVITWLVPANFFEAHLGGRFSAMLVMLVAGIPMYVCATSSTPIAAALVMKGLNPGAALVFLLAGPATNMATITMVVRLLGKKALAVYLGAIGICSLGLGMVTDALYGQLGMSATVAVGEASELLPGWIEIGAAMVLAGFIANAVWRDFRHRNDCSCRSHVPEAPQTLV